MRNMNLQEAIDQIRKEQKVSRSALGARLGLTGDAVWQKLFNQKDLNADMALQLLQALDYEIVVQPREKRKTDDQIVLTPKGVAA